MLAHHYTLGYATKQKFCFEKNDGKNFISISLDYKQRY